MTTTNKGPDLEAIKPVGPGKYSPNLYKWLKAQPRPDLIKVMTDTSNGNLMIGHVDNIGDGPWLHGARLMAVLCEGKKTRSFAYAIGKHFPFVEIPDFWERYTAEGRCAIDPEHERCFTGDETRWHQHGDIRECLWCGNRTERLETWIEPVQRQTWKPVDQSTKGSD